MNSWLRAVVGRPECRRFLLGAAVLSVITFVVTAIVWNGPGALLILAASLVYLYGWLVSTKTRQAVVRAERAAAARYREIFENAVVGMFQTTPDGRPVAVNHALARLFGYASPEEFLAVVPNVSSLYADSDTRADIIARLQADHPIRGLEVAFRHRSGRAVWAALNARPIMGPDETMTLVEGTLLDITDQRNAEAAFRNAEERLRTAFQHAPIGMGLQSLDGRWLQVNEALSRIAGYTQEELLTMRFQDITHPDDLPAEEAHVERLIAGETSSYSMEKRYVHAQGHDVWVIVHRSIVRDADGQPRHFIAQIEDITQRKQVHLMLTHMAMHDSLTGLPNRTLAVDRLEQAQARSTRQDSDVAVLFLDLDRFKVVNDSLGHGAGDRLLMSAGERLARLMRPSDTVARIGGDEFLIICELNAPDQVEVIAERIVSALSEPFDLGDDEVILGTSVGVAVDHGGASSSEELIRDADAAMYRAKEAGRNRYMMFDPSMRLGAVARLETEQALRRALDRNEFVLHYQPLVNLDSSVAVGVEALIRWNHPERGLVPPMEFIPMAEETGLIIPIGEWVLGEACRQHRRWRQEAPDMSPLRIAVNLSVKQLQQPDLAAMVERVVRENEMDPSSLVLEITESVLTDDAEATAEALVSLKKLGVRLSVDDFGTGYSSLLYLKRFPVDTLKVDRSFVDGLGSDPEDSAIVAGVLGLARTLGLSTVAEGVETEGQRRALSELGCDLAQGFLFAQPEPADRLAILHRGMVTPV